MTVLAHRRCRVTVDKHRVEGLRVAFKVKKTTGMQPNTMECSITNLSGATRAAMVEKGATVILEAGYQSNFAMLFIGNARTIDHVREHADWVTKIECGDGEAAIANARVSESFGAGTGAGDIVSKLGSALGLNPGNIGDKRAALNAKQYAGGLTVMGKAATELDRVVKGAGMTWSVQDGAIFLLKPRETLKGQAVVLSPATGLIGSPEHGSAMGGGGMQDVASADEGDAELDPTKKPKVLKVKSLLQPIIKPGIAIQVKSEGTNGFFRAESVVHTGDTGGGDWYTEVELEPIS